MIVKDEREAKYEGFHGPCSCHRNCVENMITNYAIAERYKCSIEELPKIADTEPIWDIIANYLAQLCLSLTYTLSPHVIVIGGGVVLKRKQVLPAVREYLKKFNNNYVQLPPLEDYIQETQVNENGLHGSASYMD